MYKAPQILDIATEIHHKPRLVTYMTAKFVWLS